MSLDNRVEQLIREAVEQGAPDAPPPVGPGPDCPSIVSFEHGVTTGWRESPALRKHVSECLHCQRMTAAVWRDSCPPRETVLWYRRNPELCPDAVAMRIHLEQHGCERCDAIRSRPAGSSGLWRGTIGIAASLIVAVILVTKPYQPRLPDPEPVASPRPMEIGAGPTGSKGFGVSKGLFDPGAIDLGICAANLDPLRIPFPSVGAAPRSLTLHLPPRDRPRQVNARIEAAAGPRDFPGLAADETGLLVITLEPGYLRKGERYRLEIVGKDGERAHLCSPEFTFE